MTEKRQHVMILGMGKTYEGKECKHGHGTLRYAANGTCVVCNVNKSKSLKQAKLSQGQTRYFGKVCSKHPELKGERMVSGSSCVACLRERSTALQKKNGYPVMKRQVEKLTNAVFDHYGHRCCKCGADDPDVLTIDHTLQNGHAHLNPAGERYRGVHLYRWLVNNGFPDGFRTLCANCNMKAYKMHVRGEKY